MNSKQRVHFFIYLAAVALVSFAAGIYTASRMIGQWVPELAK